MDDITKPASIIEIPDKMNRDFFPTGIKISVYFIYFCRIWSVSVLL